MNYPLAGSLLLAFALTGCGSGLPDCNSEEVKKTLLSLNQEEMMKTSLEDKKFRLTESIDMLTTTNDSEKNKKSCNATITYAYPTEANEEFKSKINVNYVILKNEASNGFYIQATGLDLREPKEMQIHTKSLLEASVKKNLGFEIQQDEIYSKVKDNFIKNNFQQDGNPLDCSKGCIFKKKNNVVEVFTQMNDGNSYRGSVQLPKGELVTNAYYSYID